MRTVAALLTVFWLTACGGEDPAGDIAAPESIDLSSPAFEDGGTIPVELTCDGADVSPSLAWSGGPDATTYAITVVDPDADGFVHWVAYGIPGSVASLQQGELPDEAIQGTNDFDEAGYGGPCPPEGDEPHEYVLTIYALGTAPEDPPAAGNDLAAVLDAISCCVAATGELVGTFGR
ncbi:MAG: YbhB/YbcL family Raf kinase inhibitor-like protein [Actinomycetota bacterium]